MYRAELGLHGGTCPPPGYQCVYPPQRVVSPGWTQNCCIFARMTTIAKSAPYNFTGGYRFGAVAWNNPFTQRFVAGVGEVNATNSAGQSIFDVATGTRDRGIPELSSAGALHHVGRPRFLHSRNRYRKRSRLNHYLDSRKRSSSLVFWQNAWSVPDDPYVRWVSQRSRRYAK